jgi:glyoxylase-like metal-dependent hydrolase (beta-lactamase superfamily II)/8-oxo-dGTP pyrophosphatase MutT (NUDIX family)
MAFGAGLHVFPGGRVEPADGEPRLLARSAVPDAHRVAALRELFEEAGVLVAGRPGRPPSDRPDRQLLDLAELETPLPPAELPGLRAALAAGQISLVEILEAHDLVLATDRLVPIARWQTPRVYPRRFDTQFFAVELAPDVVLELDPREVAGHDWLSPAAALEAMARGEIQLWPPTSTTLQRLERARDMAGIRSGLGLIEGLPYSVRGLGGGVVALTGGHAFGPTGRPANTLLVGQERVVVIDPGDPDEMFIDRIEAEAASLGGRIVAIALTHVDPGHAAGSLELHERTGAPILAGPGGAAVLSWPVEEVGDGATIGLGDTALSVIATPGHRPDHLAFGLSDGTILSGDALTDRPTLILPPQGDVGAARTSLERLIALGPRRIVPGHGDPIEAPDRAIRAALAGLAPS